jgi:hypothetical protein
VGEQERSGEEEANSPPSDSCMAQPPTNDHDTPFLDTHVQLLANHAIRCTAYLTVFLRFGPAINVVVVV